MPAADALPGAGIGVANNPFIKPFVVLALPGMYIFYKYNQYKRKRKENARRRLTERELQHLNCKIDKLLSKLEENEPELATCQEEEVRAKCRKLMTAQYETSKTHIKNCVICIHAKATMMTAPCGHQVVCRKCFVKTIQIAVSQRLLPLRCVICRAKILRLKTGPALPSSISGYSVNSRASSGSLLSSSNHHHHTTTALLHPHRSSNSAHHMTATSTSSSSSGSSSIGGGPGPSHQVPSSESRDALPGTSGLVPASDSLYSVSSGSTGSTVSSSTSASSSGSSGSSVGSRGGRGGGRLTCCPCGNTGQGKGHHCLGAYPRQPTSGSLRRSQQHAMKMRLQEYCRPSGGVGYLPPIKESAANSPIHGSCGQPATPPPSTRIRCAQKIITQLESAPLLGTTSSTSLKSIYGIQNHCPSQFHKYTESSTTPKQSKHSDIESNNNNNQSTSSSSTTKTFKGNKYSKLPNNNPATDYKDTKNNIDVIRLASEEDCSIELSNCTSSKASNSNSGKKSSGKRWWSVGDRKKKSKDKDDKHKDCNLTEKDDNKKNEQAEKEMEMMQKCKNGDEMLNVGSGSKLRFRKGISYTEDKL